ncbi:MAG: hypothetical protein FH756_17585 [Firmicutes bacterium]|nr:hypothetical protein [Bacillota bacterium]
MKKIKDRIILGAISGVVTSVPVQIIDALLHERGITDVPYGYSASRIFLAKNKTKSPASKALSALINFTNAGLVGTTIAYTLSLTGKDKAIIKGAGVGTIMWVSIAGLLSNVGLNVQSKKPATPLLSFAEHVIFGTVCSSIITKISDDSLFPDKDIREQDKIPLVYTGQE